MGLWDLFDENANFTHFSKDPQLKCDHILHKAKIEINEYGATAVGTSTILWRQMSFVPVFNCDHPFMFVMHDAKNNEILFASIFRAPNDF